MNVSKSFKHLVDRHLKQGGPLKDSGLASHKEFAPFVEHFTRNGPEWGDREQGQWNFSNIDLSTEGQVHIYFSSAAGPQTIGLSFPEDVVVENLKNAQTGETATEPAVSKRTMVPARETTEPSTRETSDAQTKELGPLEGKQDVTGTDVKASPN